MPVSLCIYLCLTPSIILFLQRDLVNYTQPVSREKAIKRDAVADTDTLPSTSKRCNIWEWRLKAAQLDAKQQVETLESQLCSVLYRKTTGR